MTIDDLTNIEFKNSARDTKKQYCSIAKYFLTTLRKLNNNDNIHTEFEYRETIIKNKEMALAYTRDYIWFDEKN